MPGIRAKRIAQIAVTVGDLERAKSFYRDRMGLNHLFDAPPGLSFFQCGEVRLMLTLPEGQEADAGAIVYYEVEDVDAAYRTLAEADVPFASAPHFVARLGEMDLWLAVCRDPDANMVGLMSYRPST